MINKKMVPFLAVTVILLGGFLGYQWLVADRVEEPFVLLPDNAEAVVVGKAVYDANCASCHGANLEGQANWRQRTSSGRLPAPPHDETGHTWHHADKVLFNLTKYGPQFVAGPNYESDMPAFDGVLSDDEIIAALSYIKSTWNMRERETQDEITRRTVVQ